MRKRLTKADEQALIRAYQEWEPNAPGAISLQELAERHGTTRQTVMNVLQRNGIPNKTQERAVNKSMAVAQQASAGALDMLLERLISSELRVKVLEKYILDHMLPLP